VKGNAPIVIAIGELLWDEFPDGARLGGAPANFAVHCASLGAQAHLVSRVGDDERGRQSRDDIGRLGVNIDSVQTDPSLPTGSVIIDMSGHVHTFTIVENVAWDAIKWRPECGKLARRADVIAFGSLAQRDKRSRDAIGRLLSFASPDCIKFFDINFRQHYHSSEVVRFSLQQCDILKLSDEEIPILRRYFQSEYKDDIYMRRLGEEYGIKIIILTLGAKGCRVFTSQEEFSACEKPVEVVNTVGSGDAFSAAFVVSYLAGHDLETCAKRANEVGGYVATRGSATPELPEDYRLASDQFA
jgi:fructokinase